MDRDRRERKRQTVTRQSIETQHHKALVQFLRAAEGQLPDLAFVKHTANESGGGQKVTRRNPKTGRTTEVPLDVLIAASMGVRAGVWDFEYIGRNRAPVNGKPAGAYLGLAIEMKAPGKTLSEEQKQWRAHYERNHWYTIVFYHYVAAAQFLIVWVGGDLARFLVI